jgi:two-component system response regulator FlrC
LKAKGFTLEGFKAESSVPILEESSMSSKHILAAESDRNMRRALFTAVTRLGHAVEPAADGEEALRKFKEGRFDLVFLDLALSGGGGQRLLKAIKSASPEVPVVVMSSGGGMDEAVSAMREGAQDYLVKPFPAGIVEETILRLLSREPESFRGEPSEGSPDPPAGERKVVYRSKIMERLLNLASAMSDSTATVLLQGESGTGKELLARHIHNESSRSRGPFVAVNCAGLPESLLESELFGHEKGAFTGALSRKPGKFDLAAGGTILLDEITEMDISLQAKLLRVLQEGEIDPVGGKGPHKIDVRVIATTNRKLKEWAEAGKFRSDLYYRLNVMPFFIPPLRERREDIEPLALFFMEKYARLNNREINGISPEAMEILLNHDWPGNIRELENTMVRAVLLASSDRIEASGVFMDEEGFMAALEESALRSDARPSPAPENHLPENPLPMEEDQEEDDPSPDLPRDMFPASGENDLPVMTIGEMEKRLIGKALTQTSGNRTHAARLLGISVRTLRNKLHEYTRPEFPAEKTALG